MKIRPLNNRVLIKRIEELSRTPGGLFLPDSAKEKPIEGEVLAVGEGKTGDDGKLIPMSVMVGDRVVYSKYSGTEIKVDGEEYLLMREDDILGIVER
ncbi:MAG: co-chaperone GroES [Pseudomonadota bacterium]